MSSSEAFYVLIDGAQKGPYTLRHLDHLLNSGLIPVDTLYWADGVEEWHPLTELIPLRKKPRTWKRLGITAAVLVILGAFVAFFGPTIADGWREGTQREYTESGAYWSARGAVRGQAELSDAVVRFSPESAANVSLTPPATAEVVVRGDVIGSDGKTAPKAWKVQLSFNALRCEWFANEVRPMPE